MNPSPLLILCLFTLPPAAEHHKVEVPVADGLAWLAAHQRPDGMWDRLNFDQLCPPNDRCSQTALERTKKNADVGVSSLAALAFLGAGYTHDHGKYAHPLSQVFSYILAQQNGQGSFAPGSGLQMFNDAIATLAIAEAYGLTDDPVLRPPLQKAVRHLERAQQGGGGWTYTDDLNARRNDTSITGWVIMALKSAQAAGVPVSLETRFRIIDHFEWATEPDGRVRHSNLPPGTAKDRKTGRPKYRYGTAMTAVGLLARSALGFRLDDTLAVKQTNLLLADLPSLLRLRGRDPTGLHNEYYWYFGTLAMLDQEPAAWEKWRHAIRTSVLEYQQRPVDRKGHPFHLYGSWPAYGRGWGRWGRIGGRIYSTAINTLTLEIYFGHRPAYLSSRSLLGPADIRRQLARMPSSRHEAMLKLAKRMQPDTSEPVLLDLLKSPNQDIRIAAAVSLANLDSPMGRPVLQQIQHKTNKKYRRIVENALKKIDTIRPADTYGPITEINSQAGMLLFDTGGKPLYYGQRVSIVRNGQAIAIASVNRRFTREQAAAAKIEEGGGWIQVGDQVMGIDDQ